LKKFSAIEGLRGWLASTVVVSHIAYAGDITAKGFGPLLRLAGDEAVVVFIIISGFVITHLLIEKREIYPVYILRRFMRIFPLFAVMCAVGYFATPLLVSASRKLAWSDASWFTEHAHYVQSQFVYFWPNVLAHLTMMHGAISDNVLPGSAFVFISPGWSLSLDWQFYLIAPLTLLAAQNTLTALLGMAVMGLLAAAYNFGAFGNFVLPSILFAAAPFFAIGIVSRIVYSKLTGSMRWPAIALALLIGLMPLGSELVPFLIWGCIYVVMIADRELDSADKVAVQIVSGLLGNRVATFLGARSYSIYLCHMPVIGLTLYFLSALLIDPSRVTVFFVLLACVTPLTLGFACLLYLGVERPGIALGNLVATRDLNRAGAQLTVRQHAVIGTKPAPPV
jgi:peptidoglycan/LPS O-acetylase OafA/YrhL